MSTMNLSNAQWRKSSHSGHQGGDCIEVASITLAVQWQKSSRSAHQGGECVEVASLRPAVDWQKSSHSGPHGGECVEVASLVPVVAVRDSKDPDGPKLTFTPAEWSAFTQRIKASEAVSA